ncbi:MAG TPA: RES family NAD+ phosphorylase [Vicinamibacterales bacterium]|nr:RES family NAD+ phosphorylase [Vicinamibacterales bacterium]
MPTWTPAALSSERRGLSGLVWRVVEAQHRVSTMKIVDTLEEQQALESLIEDAKPPLPVECRALHYLLATPFRYGAPYPRGSRFRRAGHTPGVFYASTTVATAVTEAAFHRLLFFAESPGTPWPANAGECTAFSVRTRTPAGLDLTQPPFDVDRRRWTHPTAYGPCQLLAEAAREVGVEILRYPSARDPHGTNVALLSCRAFASREPVARQIWRLHFGAHGVRAIADDPDTALAFDRQAFADPRIAALVWDR